MSSGVVLVAKYNVDTEKISKYSNKLGDTNYRIPVVLNVLRFRNSSTPIWFTKYTDWVFTTTAYK